MLYILVIFLLFEVSELPENVNSAVKVLMCPKIKLEHMTKDVYNPTCLKFCAALLGVR